MGKIISSIHDQSYQRLYEALPPGDRYNGLYYYSQTFENYIVPRVKTDRPWSLVGIKSCGAENNMIVIAHDNLHPDKTYAYLHRYFNTVCICNTRDTAEAVSKYSYSIYLPTCVEIEEVRKFGEGIEKDQDTCFAGNPWPALRDEINQFVPPWVHRFGPMPREQFLPIVAHYKNVYAIGVTAVEARALGCNILKRRAKFEPEDFPLFDCKDAAKCLQIALEAVTKQKVNRPFDCTKLPEFINRKQK